MIKQKPMNIIFLPSMIALSHTVCSIFPQKSCYIHFPHTICQLSHLHYVSFNVLCSVLDFHNFPIIIMYSISSHTLCSFSTMCSIPPNHCKFFPHYNVFHTFPLNIAPQFPFYSFHTTITPFLHESSSHFSHTLSTVLFILQSLVCVNFLTY